MARRVMHRLAARPVPLDRRAPAFALAFVLAGAVAGDRASAPPVRADAPWPTRFAWTWDRAEDLSFLPADVGVAPVVATVEIAGRDVRVRPARTPLRLREGTWRLPVVHVDALPAWHPVLDDAAAQALAAVVVEAARRGGVRAVQVDFEALPSQRAFYAGVLRRVRDRLPDTRLSITALASWCLDDRWLGGLPVDEVVAMAFRLGLRAAPSTERVRRTIAASSRWREPACNATGVAADEPPLAGPATGTRYLFSPRPWDVATWARLAAASSLATAPFDDGAPPR
jgi:hypothetical protein